MMTRLIVIATLIVGCGPGERPLTATEPDAAVDAAPPCIIGTVETCYTGEPGTAGVGPCKSGTRLCQAGNVWTQCLGEVLPAAESCSDQIDNNCNTKVDEDEDADGDGFRTCGGDCCDSTECSAPSLVNPGAFEATGNTVDDDCDGAVDNALAACDQNITSNTTNGMDFAKAIDLCQTTTATDANWGVLTATLTLADGTGLPSTNGHAVRDHFGTGLSPLVGSRMALLSTGHAAGVGDTNPNYQDFQSSTNPGNNKESPFPADFFAANNNTLPNAPGCPAPSGAKAFDPVMLTVRVRVPTNARSFRMSTNFFSSEFPEFTCSAFNDFFVVLLDSTYSGTPANPADKNLAFYAPPASTARYPVGVNLASGNTGLFTQCVNGNTGCSNLLGPSGTISTCTSTAQLAGTGLDTPKGGALAPQCNSNSVEGGGTGWLVTSGNVTPGEIITLRIAIWDTSDHILDSIAVVDAFEWSVDVSQPGTVIF